MVVPTFKERMEKNPRFNWYNSDFDYEIWIDPTLAHNLLCLLESAKSGNGDIVLVIDGEEGCQPAGNKVLLANGNYKNIEKIKKGDKLLSPQEDGSVTIETVTNTCAWNCDKTYLIFDRDNPKKKYTCSYNHLIPVKDGNGGYHNFTAKELHNYRGIYTTPILGHNNSTTIKVYEDISKRVYGFSLTGDSKWYVTNDGFITHNTGKSTLARQVGRLLDPTLTEKRIEFSPDAAKEAHFQGLPSLESREFVPELYRQGKYDGKPWEVVMLDESAKLDRKRTMASSSVDFMGFISQSRQLHKIFIMVLPNVHMLDGYIAEHRTVALIHCEKEKRTNRRIYKWYGRKHLKEMFKTDMHKRKLYPRGAAFSGTFTSKNPFDLTVYEQKKAAALEAYRKKENGDGDPALVGADKEDIIRIIEEAAMVYCLKNPKIHQVCVYKALNIKPPRWLEIKRRVKKKYNLSSESTIGPVKRFNDKKEFMAGLLKERNDDEVSSLNIDEYSVEMEEEE